MNYEEPFRSCYLFGALRYLANLKDTVCLIHGPTGCSFFCRNSVMILNGYKDTVEHEGPKYLVHVLMMMMLFLEDKKN